MCALYKCTVVIIIFIIIIIVITIIFSYIAENSKIVPYGLFEQNFGYIMTIFTSPIWNKQISEFIW